MGTPAQKLQSPLDSVDDIQKALEEKGFDMSDVELSRYGALIRLITSSGSGSGEGSSTGNEGQPLNGLKLDNVIFVSKSVQNIAMKDIPLNTCVSVKLVQNITMKDISLNTYISTKSLKILNKDELIKYQYPLLLNNAYFMQKNILYENDLNITNNATILSKEIIHVNIDNIIEQEE